MLACLDGFINPCVPTRAANPPVGPGWVHEIKHDGYRLQVRREGGTVRLKVKNPDSPAMIRHRDGRW